MLNLFKLNNKKPKKIKIKNTENDNTKQYSPATKEWYNSVYAYNKNTLNLLPVSDNVVFTLFRSYLNLYSMILNLKIKYRKLRIRIRRMSSHRIYVSKAEFKHTVDKVVITFYIYNRQKYNFLSKIQSKVLREKYFTLLEKEMFERKIKLIKIKGLKIFNKIKNEKKTLIKNVSLNAPTLSESNKLKKNMTVAAHVYPGHNNFENLYYKDYIKMCLKREILHIYYKQMLFFNKSKFENTFLYKLNKLIKNVYNKNIELNIISLKYFFLNSDIFTESLTIKIRKKNRLLNVLKGSLAKVKTRNLSRYKNAYSSLGNSVSSLNHLKDSNIKNNFLGDFVDLRMASNMTSKEPLESEKNLKHFVLNSFKHKIITGIRLEASGRLSRRITASRSVFKIKYKGSLKNIRSSYKGLKSAVVRGNIRPNLQYSLMSSKTRIGAFGLKSWVSSN